MLDTPDQMEGSARPVRLERARQLQAVSHAKVLLPLHLQQVQMHLLQMLFTLSKWL
jgi:hypothetical protein